MQDVVAGQIEGTFVNLGEHCPMCERATQRLSYYRQKPFGSSAGNPGFGRSGIAGFVFFVVGRPIFPKGTPKNIINKLNAAAVSTFNDPAVHRRLLEQGFIIPPREQRTPEALGAYQKAEIEKWWPIIKAANIKAD